MQMPVNIDCSQSTIGVTFHPNINICMCNPDPCFNHQSINPTRFDGGGGFGLPAPQQPMSYTMTTRRANNFCVGAG